MSLPARHVFQPSPSHRPKPAPTAERANSPARAHLLRRIGLPLAISGLLLTALIFAADWRQVVRALTALDPIYFAAAMAWFIPQWIVSASRWQAVVRPLAHLTWMDALRQTLAASAFNLIVPGKLGDLSKPALIAGLPLDARIGCTYRATAEKGCDVAALLFWLAMGWCGVGFGGALLICGGAWAIWAVANLCCGDWARGLSGWRGLAPFTCTLWLLHLLQIHALLKASGVPVDFAITLERAPLALFAGLIPLTAMGVGTRDAAFIWLFSDFAPSATLAVVGLLTTLRYLIPGAIGLTFLPTILAQTQSSEELLPEVGPPEEFHPNVSHPNVLQPATGRIAAGTFAA